MCAGKCRQPDARIEPAKGRQRTAIHLATDDKLLSMGAAVRQVDGKRPNHLIERQVARRSGRSQEDGYTSKWIASGLTCLR